VEEAHRRCRERYGLPPEPPRHPGGKECRICFHRCRLGPGERGYCGLPRERVESPLPASTTTAYLTHYYDPLPTNCVADWVCPGGTGAGYPRYACCAGPERGYRNLAVFFHACNFNCLYCQNWHFRRIPHLAPASVADLAARAGGRTSCICYFGGDPGPQVPYALRVSREARRNRAGDILRICWESNGGMSPSLLRAVARVTLDSGGCIKLDLKAFHPRTHLALTGVENRQTLDSLRYLASLIPQRPDPPFLVASTLLVPGYVDAEEVGSLARLLASLDARIPYTLLAFQPEFYLDDLPPTSWQLARACLQAAREAGLTRVRLGNVHLLS